MNRVAGKVAVITGAGSGVGQACMKLFAAEGAQVVGVGRTQASLDATLKMVTDAGGEGIVVAADLALEASADQVMDAAVAAFGRVDIVVNAAGVGYSWLEKSPGSMGDIVQTTADKWHEVMNLNLDSCFYMCRAAIVQFRKQGGGAIVNVASISGMLGLSVAHTYTAAKGAMINLTRSLAVTYPMENIRANCIAPGFIASPMTDALNDKQREAILANVPLGKLGAGTDIGAAVVYLASDEAGYVTGQTLHVNGGMAMI